MGEVSFVRLPNGIQFFLDGKTIGNYDREKNTFQKFVNKKKSLKEKHNHFHIKSNSFGIDAEVIKMLPENATILYHDRIGKNTYKTNKGKFEEFGTYLHFITDYRDNKAQKFLELSHWEKLPYMSY